MMQLISCQQATLFVEQQADAPLAAIDYSRLRLHLRTCPLCSRYAKQSVFLNQLASNAAHNYAAQPALSDAARVRLQRALEEKQKS